MKVTEQKASSFKQPKGKAASYLAETLYCSTTSQVHLLFFNAVERRIKIKLLVTLCRQRGRVVRSVVFTTAMIARLMVQLPPKPRCCVLG